MPGDLAVVFDVAGTMLRMFRVAKDMSSGMLMENVITSDLIMERPGRALVVPGLDPLIVDSAPPDDPIRALFCNIEHCIEVTCSSTPVSKKEVMQILRGSKAKVADLQEAYRAVKSRCPNSYSTTGLIIDSGQCEVSHTISTGGRPFPGLSRVLGEMKGLGADIFVASGDSKQSLMHLADQGIELDCIYPVASPRRKQEIVTELKRKYDKVVMIGDGLNDLYALEEADMAVLTVQQNSHPAQTLLKAADRIITDIFELPGILKSLRESQNELY